MNIPTDSLRYAGLVKRYHTWPVIREQTVAEHTWHVLRIYDQIFGLPSLNAIRAVIYHDVGEVKTGDAPFPVKRENSDMKAAYDRVEAIHRSKLLDGVDPEDSTTVDEHRYLKICDLLEMWEYGVEERAKGNTLAQPIIDRTLEAALQMCETPHENLAVAKFVEKGTIR
jgi:5'-deoxynucleotidase YfbR-like HD superfamily hydrolase